jgi:hypothetical protein
MTQYGIIAISILLLCGPAIAEISDRGKQGTSFHLQRDISRNPDGCEKQHGQKQQQFLPGEVLVKFKVGLTGEEIEAIREAYGLSLMKRIERIGVYRFKIPPGSTVGGIVDALNKHPHVEYAEPNYTVGITDK